MSFVRGRLVASLLLVGIIVPASSAMGSVAPHLAVGADSIGIRLLAEPGAFSTSPLARSYVVDQLAPGTSLSRTVEIYNTTTATADVSVYAAGADVVRGTIDFAPGHDQDALSSWTSVDTKTVRLPAGTTALDTLTIDVPATASTGERYAVLWAQVSAAPLTAGGVLLVNRVGVRMYVSIGLGGAPPSSFAIGPLRAERSATGKLLVIASVHNTGQGTLGISGSLRLSNGPGGLRAGPIVATLGSVLAPHASEPVTTRINAALPRGPWRAQLSLTSGLNHRSTTSTITFPGNSGGVKNSSLLRPPVLIALAAVLAAIALGLTVLFRHRRRRGRAQAAADAR